MKNTKENRLYTIYTEYKSGIDTREALKRVNSYFQGYNYHVRQGVWKGTEETSLVIEIVTEQGYLIEHLAKDLREILTQEAVLVTSVPVEVYLVTA